MNKRGENLDSTVLVAIIGFLGTCVGTIGGILVTSKLTNYRLQQLEEKVNKHNTVIERTFKLEGRMTEAEHDIRDLKNMKE